MKHFLVNLIPNRLIWQFAKPYIAGDSMQKVFDKVDNLWKSNKFSSTIDLLGENALTNDEVEKVVSIYLELIQGLKGKHEFVTISLKPSAIGATLSKELCLINFRKILTAAKNINLDVTMDMEDSSLTQITLDVYKELRPDFPNFGTVLQTRLFRTAQDIANLPHNSHIRICIGIYREPKDIALTQKPEMKKKIVEYLGLLIDNGHRIGIATHDENTIHETLALLDLKKSNYEQVEYQFLLGVPREKVQHVLQQKGFTIRFYVPFTMHWTDATAYAKRRFIENPNMAVYTVRNLTGYRSVRLLILLGLGILLLIFFLLLN